MQRGEIPDREAQKQAEAKDQMREQMVDRVDLTPTIEAILDGSFKPKVSNADLNKVFHTYPDEDEEDDPAWEAVFDEEYKKAMEIWNRSKIERNSSVSIFISEVWNDPAFIEKRKVFVPDKLDPGTLGFYFQLAMETSDLFDEALEAWRLRRNKELKKPRSEWSPKDRAYYRYRRIIRFGNKSDLLQGDSESFFIGRGINTATETAFGLSRIITTLVKENGIELTNDELTELFRKSFGPVIMPFASMNQEIATELLKGVGMNLDATIPKTEFFKLVVDTEGKYKLTLDHEALFQLKDDNGQPFLSKETLSETTWCPAKYSTGNQKDVIREYFEWIVEIAQKYAFPLVEKKAETATV